MCRETNKAYVLLNTKGLYILRKETCMSQKRPMYVLRDQQGLCIAQRKGHVHFEKRDLYASKEATQKAYQRAKRTIYVQRDLYMFKETHICAKRPILVQRDLYMCKEATQKAYQRAKRPTQE